MPNRNKWFVLVLAVASVEAGAHALAQQHALSGVEILRKVEQTVEVVRDYTVEVQADVNMERMRIPKMQATMYYKRPNKIHFESTSFAMLPREGMMLDPTVLRESYVATVQESEVAEEKKVYKLQLAAMESKSRLRQLYVWVDGSNWTIVKMETIPYQGRVLTVTITQALQEGKYWLPRTLKASFDVAGRDTTEKRIEPPATPPTQWEGVQRPPRSGSITVTYSNYKVNVGLSDEVFQQRERAGKEK
ncbi:MAG TPA: hypothetical protein DCP63_02505 [Bacteroidetes bacterium]|nr:hypothetical protein [Bacteroidota bacterium]